MAPTSKIATAGSKDGTKFHLVYSLLLYAKTTEIQTEFAWYNSDQSPNKFSL
jgi:hypothetical protein